MGFLYRLQTVGVGCLAPALCVPVPNGQGISPAAAGGNDAPARRGRARGRKPIRFPPSCQSPSFPSGRAARARVSDAFRLPPNCCCDRQRIGCHPRGSALPCGVEPALLVALGKWAAGTLALRTLRASARPYLRQQMPQIFGQMPMYLLLPKGKGVIRKRGETSFSPLREPQRAYMRATAAQRRLLASRSAPAARSGPFPPPAGGEIPAREARAPKGPLG